MTVRLALIGWGAIGRAVAPLLADTPIELVAVGVRSRRDRNDLPPGAAMLADPSELAATRPDIVAEAAGRDAVEPWGHAALSEGADFVVSSVSALADDTLLDALRSSAAAGGAASRSRPEPWPGSTPSPPPDRWASNGSNTAS